MKQTSLYFALAAALVSVAPQVGAALVAKQLAGPPSEFTQMREAQPEASALVSKSALLPITLSQNKQGLWQWQGQLPVETSNLRLAVFTGAASDWQLNLRAPFSTRAVNFDTLAKQREETLYGMDNNEYPADYYSFEGLSTGEYTFSVEAASASQTQGFVLINSESPERLRAYQDRNGARVGESVGFVAHGVSATNPYAKAAVNSAVAADMIIDAYLRVTSPSGETFTELMFDDGLHQDGIAGDGVYGGNFLAVEAGQYIAQVVAHGQTATGAPLVRTTEHVVPVVADQLSLAADFATSHIVNDQRLMVDLALSGAQPDAHYRVISEVWGRSRKDAREAVPVAWIGGMVDNVNDTLNVGLDARWIALANAQGPFELRNLRIEDPNHFVPLVRADRLNLDINAMPVAANRAVTAIDEVMIMGEKPAQETTRAGARLLLVHGYCSGNVWGQVSGQFASASVFADFNRNRSHDTFARLVGTFGSSYSSFGIVAHSQGGAAAVHLYTYYYSGLDYAGPGRLIQSVGTPYQGTALAGNLAALGAIFGAGCGTNNDLTYNGASAWLSGIPSFARSVTNYYTTSFTDNTFSYDYCHLATDLFLSDPDDGTTERSRGQLSGAINRGHKTGWCHTSGMRDPAQYLDSSRNSTMNANAAR